MAKSKIFFNKVEYTRLIMMLLIVAGGYGVFPSITAYLELIINFAGGVLFALFGFFTLTGNLNRYKSAIKKLLIVFLIMIVTYTLLNIAYLYFLYRQNCWAVISEALTKRSLFNFAVLNFWPFPLGKSIWYIQAALYAMPIFYVLEKLGMMKFDIPICIFLFLFAFIVGEGARLINFSFLGYSYISGNFLTRAMPYMLLGRIFGKNRAKLIKKRFILAPSFIVAGICIALFELLILSQNKKLIYYNHLMGFIFITFGVLILCVTSVQDPTADILPHFSKCWYSTIYYTYEFVGQIILLLLLIFNRTNRYFVLPLILISTFILALVIFVIKRIIISQRIAVKEQDNIDVGDDE